MSQSAPSWMLLQSSIRLCNCKKVFIERKYQIEVANNRGSHGRCSVIKGVLRNYAKFTGKHLCQSLFLIKLQTWEFSVNFAKFLRTPFLIEHLWWLLLSEVDIYKGMLRFEKDWKRFPVKNFAAFISCKSFNFFFNHKSHKNPGKQRFPLKSFIHCNVKTSCCSE